ncbi:hypothetical protein pb186bvf_019289 [Paramecium bursaria]
MFWLALAQQDIQYSLRKLFMKKGYILIFKIFYFILTYQLFELD